MEINGKYKWTESGKLLLTTINSYIESHGGSKELLKKIVSEERKAREEANRLIRLKVERQPFFIKRTFENKGIIMQKDGRIKEFKSAKLAGEYLDVDYSLIHRSIKMGYKCRGWSIKYSGKVYYRNVDILVTK